MAEFEAITFGLKKIRDRDHELYEGILVNIIEDLACVVVVLENEINCQ